MKPIEEHKIADNQENYCWSVLRVEVNLNLTQIAYLELHEKIGTIMHLLASATEPTDTTDSSPKLF